MELKKANKLRTGNFSFKKAQKKLKQYRAKLTLPSEINVTFDSLYGLENEKEIMHDIVDYLASDTQKILPHFSYCILGEIGTGKASLVYATCKAANIPAIAIDANDAIAIEKNSKKICQAIDTIYHLANKLANIYGGCVVMFKNAHEFSLLENDSIFYASILENVSNSENVFSFMLTISTNLKVPACFAENHLFSTTLSLELPNLETREKIIEDIFKKTDIKLAPDVSASRLAKDTFGETPLYISYVIKEATLYAWRQHHEFVTSDDFSETIMKLSDGEKKEKMTEKERIATAYHEAGHVIAGYFSNPNYPFKRVEITPRASSLGLTVTDIDEKKFSYFKEDFERRIIELLGGLCAEEIVYGSHSSGVITDLSYATSIATNMVRAYGMDEDFGVMQIISNVNDSPYTRQRSEIAISNILEKQKDKTFKIINEHRAYLDALAKELISKEVVIGNEIEEIFKKVEEISKIS